jgi:predicted metal-dependent phosphoesterase TrpH
MNKTNNTLRVELHLHTRYSKDSLLPLERMIERARELGLDRVAVTDHNEIEGALAAQKLAPDLIIVGEEIQTTIGELLGYFMTEKIPAGLEPDEVLRRLKDQGAVISVAHPFDRRGSKLWQREDLVAIAPHLDAVEAFNARCLTMEPNNKANAYADEFGLAKAAGSDAHSAYEMGTATLTLPEFENAETFRAALRSAEIHGRLSSPHVRLISRHAALSKKRESNAD